jgi:hypothetical protein
LDPSGFPFIHHYTTAEQIADVLCVQQERLQRNAFCNPPGCATIYPTTFGELPGKWAHLTQEGLITHYNGNGNVFGNHESLKMILHQHRQYPSKHESNIQRGIFTIPPVASPQPFETISTTG